MVNITLNQELFQVLAVWSSVLVLKVMAMSLLTGLQRKKKKAYANPEDLMFDKSKKAKLTTDDPDVERVRRAHLNDLENCVPWFIMTFIWLWTNPSLFMAKILIPTFVISRIIHTVSYAMLAQQPTRALAFFVGYLITIYEAVVTIFYYL